MIAVPGPRPLKAALRRLRRASPAPASTPGQRGGTLLTADRHYPSSKTCAGCGAVKAKLPLPERT